VQFTMSIIVFLCLNMNLIKELCCFSCHPCHDNIRQQLAYYGQ
jgi:hypothetical protein